MAARREFIWVLLQLVFKQIIFKIINIQDFFIIKTYPGLYREGYFGEKVGNLLMILTKQSNLMHDGIPVLYQNCFHLWLSDHKQI